MLPRLLKTQFVAAIRRLLRPVVHQVITYGISYSTFNQIVKQLFVEVAEHDFTLPFKRQTDSRLAVVTGIPRKEISQLRRHRAARIDAPDVEDSVVTHVIGRWMAGPPFATPDGVPRRLRYDADEPQAASFARLVRELGVDIPVRAVLDELLRLGSVALLPNGDVELQREAHIPAPKAEERLVLLGADPAELFSSIVHNLEHAKEPWLQRKAVYDNIGSHALRALQDESRRIGGDFIRRANALLASYDRDREPEAPGGRRSRVVLGVYYFEEASGESKPDGPTRAEPVPPGRIRRKK